MAASRGVKEVEGSLGGTTCPHYSHRDGGGGGAWWRSSANSPSVGQPRYSRESCNCWSGGRRGEVFPAPLRHYLPQVDLSLPSTDEGGGWEGAGCWR